MDKPKRIKNQASAPTQEKPSAEEKKQYKKIERYQELTSSHRIIRFRGEVLYLDRDSTPSRYRPLTSDAFARMAYELFSGALVQQIKELEHMTRTLAPNPPGLDTRIALTATQDWCMDTLELVDPHPDTVFRSNVAPSSNPNHIAKAQDFLLQLANGDPLLANDMAKSMAPLFMARKPAGVIWFVGTGANGKSALINALYRLLGNHFSSLTVSAIEDGRDTPRLNGMLGNVCRESSESRVNDTERYKAIGTHEPFEVHKFHSQDMIRVSGDLHHIFNANNIPVFGDKTQGARRRTLIVPFPARFADDPTFEERTFTPSFLGGLLTIILDAAREVRDNGYKYNFSDVTLDAKESYDSEVNSAEAFLKYLRERGVEGFDNYQYLTMAYESWCKRSGLIPLGITSLRRTMQTQAKVERRSFRLESKVVTKKYFFGDSVTPPSELVSPKGIGLLVRAGNVSNVEESEATTLTPKQREMISAEDWWGR